MENSQEDKGKDIKAEKESTVELGDKVKIRLFDGSVREFKIVPVFMSAKVNPQQGIISAASPLGGALIGHSVGDTVDYSVGENKMNAKVLGIKKEPVFE